MDSIGKEFMEKTKYQHLQASDQSRNVPQPPLEADYDTQKPALRLPSPGTLHYGQVPLIEAVDQRRSHRKYAHKPIALEELTYLLWCTQGVKKSKPGVATLRTVPSAGARHAFETYLLINRVEGLKTGLYRFIAIEHKLAEVSLEKGITDKITSGCLGQRFVAASAVTFIWVADVRRMKWRYGERGYRYLHLDAGHVCQNLYLAAEGIDCGVCAIAAFNDDEINRVMGLDGESQLVIYVAAAGKKA